MLVAANLMDKNWTVVTRSPFEHERRGLEYIRTPTRRPGRSPGLGDFDFQCGDGRILEVDLLILTEAGLFLVEVKDWRGCVTGDVRTWTRTWPDGRVKDVDNPLHSAEQGEASEDDPRAPAGLGSRQVPVYRVLGFPVASRNAV